MCSFLLMVFVVVVVVKTRLTFIHHVILFNPFVRSVVKNVAIGFAATNIQQRYALVNIGVVRVAFFQLRANNCF